MEVSPVALQVAGIGVLVLIGLGAVFWVARSVMGWHGGRPVYFLPDTRHDDDDDDGDGDGPA